MTSTLDDKTRVLDSTLDDDANASDLNSPDTSPLSPVGRHLSNISSGAFSYTSGSDTELDPYTSPDDSKGFLISSAHKSKETHMRKRDRIKNYARYNINRLLNSRVVPYWFLFSYRIVATVLCTCFLIYGMALHSSRFFIFYTNVTFVLTYVYFKASFVLQWNAMHKGSIARSFDWKIKFLRTLFPVVFASSCVVSIAYWVLLHDPADWTAYTIMSHGGSALLLLGDLFLNRVKFGRSPFKATLGFTTSYLAFALTWKFITNEWIYKVMVYWWVYVLIFSLVFLFFYVGKSLTRLRALIRRARAKVLKAKIRVKRN